MDYANLSGADLTNAEFQGTSFYDATLTGANLNRCYLEGANIRYANLTDAHLNGADLTGVNLTLANLDNAKFDTSPIWPTAEFWSNTTCPDGTNSNDPGNATCGF